MAEKGRLKLNSRIILGIPQPGTLNIQVRDLWRRATQPTNSDHTYVGPSAPDVSKGSTASSSSQPRSSSTSQEDRDKEDSEGRPIRMSSSNNAKPTITDGRHSPNVDSEGNVKSDVPNDVKKHNEEMEHRYDRPYNQLGNEGKPPKGFWERPQAWTSGVVRGDIPYGRVELGKLLYDRLNGTSFRN